MDTLRIVTKDWKIVHFDAFIFITMMNGGEDDDGRPLFELIGVLNPEYDHIMLYSSNVVQKVLMAFNDVCRAVDAKKPLIDLREVEEDKTDIQTITILPNLRNQKPGDN